MRSSIIFNSLFSKNYLSQHVFHLIFAYLILKEGRRACEEPHNDNSIYHSQSSVFLQYKGTILEHDKISAYL